MRMMKIRFAAFLLALCLLLSAALAETPSAETQPVTPSPAEAQLVTPEPAETKAAVEPVQTENAGPTSDATHAASGQPVSAPVNAAPSTAPAETVWADASTSDTEPTPQTSMSPEATTVPTPDTEPTPGAELTMQPSASPEATAAPTQGAEATPSASPDATVAPTPEAGTLPPETAGEGPAWYWDGEQRRYGELEELLFLTNGTIYIASDELFILTGEAALLAREAEFALDAEVFPEDAGLVIYISDVGPNGETQENALYLWVGTAEDAPPTPSPAPTDPIEVEAELLVVPEMYRAGAWSSAVPSFTLTAVPDTLEGYTFAVSVDGGEAQAVASPYAFDAEGQHTLVFFLIDADGAQAARSTTYTAWLDMTAPEAQVQFDMQTGALTVTASDAVSGVDGISLDGGATWQSMTAAEDGSFTFTVVLTEQLEAGGLMVRDAAGNCWQSAESYGMPGGMDGGMDGGFGGNGSFGGSFGGSFSGGSGGSSGTTRTVSHSSGSEDEATPYGAVALEVTEESMYALALGGETLSLTLTLDSEAGGFEDVPSAFTAELAVWNGGEDDADFDTLILTASADDAQSPCAYRWDFTGDVYKTLFNSGVQYLVLRVGDRVTALSTAGFTAGTAYNVLKSEGAASSEFAYSLWMGEPEPVMEMEVEVRGERYLLSAGGDDMYCYDVYAGDMDLLNAAFGAAAQEEQ